MNALGDDVIDAICDELEVAHGYSPLARTIRAQVRFL